MIGAKQTEKKGSKPCMENREGKTEDRRIRKTKQAIQSSLYRLLRKKDLREIRVKELAECADINRGTFYRYYEDVGDILLESELDFLEEIHEIFDQWDAGQTDPEQRPVKELYELCKSHAELLEIVFAEERDPEFLIALWQLIRRQLAWKMENECGRDGEEAESRGGFLAGGCIAILKEWIAKGWSQPSDEIAEKTERCLFLLMPERKQL